MSIMKSYELITALNSNSETYILILYTYKIGHDEKLRKNVAKRIFLPH